MRRYRRRTVPGWLAMPLAGAVLTAATGLAFGPHGSVLVGLAAVVGDAAGRGVRRTRCRAQDEQARAASEDLLAAFADELDAGHPPGQALRIAVAGVLEGRRLHDHGFFAPGLLRDGRGADRPIRTTDLDAALRVPVDLDQVPALLAAGGEPAAVLRACQAPALRQLAVGWQVSQRTGIRLAPVAGKIAATVRADAERHRELRASLAGARSSARLVASLPVAGMLLGAMVGASPHQVLFATRSGLTCLVAGVLLDLVGLGWTNRIADAAVRSRAEPFRPRAAAHSGARRRRLRTRTAVALALALSVAVAATAVAAQELAAAAGFASVAGAAGWLFAALRRAAAADPAPQLFADLPVALDLTAACLAAGTPPEVAQRVVGNAVGGPLGPALVAAAHRTSLGRPASEAFVDLVEASRTPRLAVHGRDRAGPLVPAVVAVTRAFERSGDSGARLATTLERIADRLRGCAHVEAVEAVRRAGVLAVAPLGLCFLPAFVLLGVVPVVLATAQGLLGDMSPATGPT